MGKGKAGAFRSRGISVEKSCTINEQAVAKNREGIATAIRSASQVLIELPVTIGILKSEGRDKEIPDLFTLSRSTAQDIDSYIAEKKDLDNEFDNHVKNRPAKGEDLSTYNSRTFRYGTKYLDLNQRIADTVGKSTDQMVGILYPDKQKTEVQPA